LPGRSEHAAQAEWNETAAARFSEAGFNDWAITALFYASLHWIDAYLLGEGIHLTSHWRRQAFIRESPELVSIFGAFGLLRMDSEGARYDCGQFSRSDYEDRRDGQYAIIKTTIASLMRT
jgi:uncharacterized protein (UPF0332 family)